MKKLNLRMPGHDRYQPRELVRFFGYDYWARWLIIVQIAVMEVLCEIGFAPKRIADLFTDSVKKRLQNNITTSQMDDLERGDPPKRKGTGHDVEALKLAARPLMPEQLQWLFHFTPTSFDIICSALAIMFKRCYFAVVRPMVLTFGKELAKRVEFYAETPMLGRTHLQPANPITAGFWLATRLGRLIDIIHHLDDRANELVGKFSGPVGASNAATVFKINKLAEAKFGEDAEALVMGKLGLKQPLISTQITPPERLQRFLEEVGKLSGLLADLATDIRLLFAPEFGEIDTATMGFDPAHSTGSSTMSHKRNPVPCETTCGLNSVVGGMLVTLKSLEISWLQRDLSGSAVMRFLPMIVILTVYSLKNMTTVVSRLSINKKQSLANLKKHGDIILSELAQLALRKAGLTDAHQVVNQLVSYAKENHTSLTSAIENQSNQSKFSGLKEAWGNVDPEVKRVFARPKTYVGNAADKARQVVAEFYKIFDQPHSAG